MGRQGWVGPGQRALKGGSVLATPAYGSGRRSGAEGSRTPDNFGLRIQSEAARDLRAERVYAQWASMASLVVVGACRAEDHLFADHLVRRDVEDHEHPDLTVALGQQLAITSDEPASSGVRAAHAFSAIDSYIYGFAMQGKSLPFTTPEETAAMAEIMLAQLPRGEYPYLAELTADHVLQPGTSTATNT